MADLMLERAEELAAIKKAIRMAHARSRSVVRPLPGGPVISTRREQPARAMRIAFLMAASSSARSSIRSAMSSP